MRFEVVVLLPLAVIVFFLAEALSVVFLAVDPAVLRVLAGFVEAISSAEVGAFFLAAVEVRLRVFASVGPGSLLASDESVFFRAPRVDVVLCWSGFSSEARCTATTSK